jgi:hypothetical protein
MKVELIILVVRPLCGGDLDGIAKAKSMIIQLRTMKLTY